MSSLELHRFEVDVTPPIGDWLCGGFHGRSAAIESPLLLRGIVLSTPEHRYVIACIDYCYLIGRSQRRLEQALADGAKVPPGQVVVQSNHTHAAPMIDEEAHAILLEYAPELQLHNESYFASILSRAQEAVARAVQQPPMPVSGISFASHPVHEFASSRRVLDENGRCQIRWSVTPDQKIRSSPVGVIDPLLDLIGFHGPDGTAQALLTFYACHPQTADRRQPELISRDTLGVALDLFEKSYPGTFVMQFDGCGGDVTGGKYTTANLERNRLAFGIRLFDAMEEAFAKARPGEVGTLRWVDRTFEAPLGPLNESEAYFVAKIRDPQVSVPHKVLAAWKIHRLRRNSQTYPFRATRLSLGRAHLLFLPAELVVEYQLYAKSHCDGNLAVAAYGDSFLNYVATDEAFEQGGYEVRPDWTEVGPGIEKAIKCHLDFVLQS